MPDPPNLQREKHGALNVAESPFATVGTELLQAVYAGVQDMDGVLRTRGAHQQMTA